MKVVLILLNIQSESLRCFSRIMDSLRKFSSSLADSLEISLSFPKTLDRVSSTKDMIDLLKLLLEDILTLLDFLILLVLSASPYLSKDILLFLTSIFMLVVIRLFSLRWSLGQWPKESSTDLFRLLLKDSTSSAVTRTEFYLLEGVQWLCCCVSSAFYLFSSLILRISLINRALVFNLFFIRSIMSAAHLNSLFTSLQLERKLSSHEMLPSLNHVIRVCIVLRQKQKQH